jgi:ArsR family transcriptional regulator, arsenate/arsenite/antimonite-responsive transcriptional repressor
LTDVYMACYDALAMTTELKSQTRTDPCCEVAVVERDGLSGAERTAAVFKALADPTRLAILRAISRTREACECNIVPAFELSQPTISYHIKVLREAGLLTSERRGQWVYHRVNHRVVMDAIGQLADMA